MTSGPQTFPASVDLKGIKAYVKMGVLFAAMAVAIASVTGCAATAVGTLSAGVAKGSGNVTKEPTDLVLQPNVVFIGDSISYLWGQASFSPDFAQHATWNDQGIIGQNSYQLLQRFQDDVVSQHPDVVHILTGTNDVYPGWVLCGGNPVFDTCNNVKAMVAMAQAAGIKVIFGTIPPWGCADAHCSLAAGADSSQARYDRINTWNQWVRQYGMDNNITVADYWQALVSPDGQTYVPDLTIDGVHPSVAGYATITPLVETAVWEQLAKGAK
jgi:lysophospholipase L1-like esterase